MRALRHIERERPAVRVARAAIRSACAALLKDLAGKVAAAQRAAAAKIAKASRDDEEGSDAARAVDSADWTSLGNDVRPHLESVAKDGVEEAARQVEADLAIALDQANEQAIAWAKKRAAELVTEVSETTRKRVQELVVAGLDEGLSNDEIADELQDDIVFSESRAETVARTETAFADIQGNQLGWKASGVVAGKEWKTSADPCPECEALDGEVVELDDEFPDGDPPLHPRCECVLLPVLDDEE